MQLQKLVFHARFRYIRASLQCLSKSGFLTVRPSGVYIGTSLTSFCLFTSTLLKSSENRICARCRRPTTSCCLADNAKNCVKRRGSDISGVLSVRNTILRDRWVSSLKLPSTKGTSMIRESPRGRGASSWADSTWRTTITLSMIERRRTGQGSTTDDRNIMEGIR